MAIEKIKITLHNEDELRSKLVELSKQNPTKIIYAWAGFSKITIFINDNQPRTDCPGSVQTYKNDGGFYKNGQIVKPTKTWINRYNYIPIDN